MLNHRTCFEKKCPKSFSAFCALSTCSQECHAKGGFSHDGLLPRPHARGRAARQGPTCQGEPGEISTVGNGSA